ncbi:hypothetical protein TREPR_1389 [Treponema primitia ZAS-2]|uniref:Uncharacterized protein n=1 Tax=Treponema primitia (strain ATCC BAA-887 / DSM 12427 / ZAS-2) TaxID=545694 RepID=F5YQQ2_TREPZ|nr:hypothetical protein TREPR_1389 [Treponema primitia ZAS-2]
MLAILFTSILITAFAYSIWELRSARNTLEQYRDRAYGVKPVSRDSLTVLENQAENLRKLEIIRMDKGGSGKKNIFSSVKLSMEEKTNLIRDMLRTRSVGIERFRINNRDGGSEFTLHCPPIPFFGFLAELEEKTALEPDYISIKPASGFSTINVTVRFNHVP